MHHAASRQPLLFGHALPPNPVPPRALPGNWGASEFPGDDCGSGKPRGTVL